MKNLKKAILASIIVIFICLFGLIHLQDEENQRQMNITNQKEVRLVNIKPVCYSQCKFLNFKENKLNELEIRSEYLYLFLVVNLEKPERIDETFSGLSGEIQKLRMEILREQKRVIFLLNSLNNFDLSEKFKKEQREVFERYYKTLDIYYKSLE